jgi:hydroxymethylglutaryl-CoA lyase
VSLPATVEIVDVTPRDGLQDEAVPVRTADKVALIQSLLAAGLRRIEVASFVNPQRVPQMADAEAVLEALDSPREATLVGLVLNQRGLDRAIAAGVDEVNTVVLVTDTFSRKNQGMEVDEALAMWAQVAEGAHSAGLRAAITLSAAFGCPYEGGVDPLRVIELARRAAEAGPIEIALADTIGAGVPNRVASLVAEVAQVTGVSVRCHLHNTRNTGLANAVAALEAGAQTLDASLGGIGGCPFAPSATGNVPTEDLVHMLERMGATTGVDLDALLSSIPLIEKMVDHQTPGLVARAGPFRP